MSMSSNEVFEEAFRIVGLLRGLDGQYYWMFEDGSSVTVEELAATYKSKVLK